MRGRTRSTTPEATLERRISGLFSMVGGVTFTLSQGFRGALDPKTGKWAVSGGTRQTPGLPDLEIWFPALRQMAKFEVKTPAGIRLHNRMIGIAPGKVTPGQVRDWRRAHNQQQYADLCFACGIPYGRGGMEEAGALLISLGLLNGTTDARGGA